MSAVALIYDRERNCIPLARAAHSVQSPRDLGHEDDGVTDLKQDMIALLPRLRRFARTLTRSVPEADDLVQEACLRALSRSDQWDPSQPLDRWMFRDHPQPLDQRDSKTHRAYGRGCGTGRRKPRIDRPGNWRSRCAGPGTRPTGGQPAGRSVQRSAGRFGRRLQLCRGSRAVRHPIGTVMSRMHRARRLLSEKLAQSEGAQA